MIEHDCHLSAEDSCKCEEYDEAYGYDAIPEDEDYLNGAEDYPMGGTLDQYDIERDKDL